MEQVMRIAILRSLEEFIYDDHIFHLNENLDGNNLEIYLGPG